MAPDTHLRALPRIRPPLAFVALALAALLLAWVALQPRTVPVADAAHHAAFSVARAQAHVRALAAAPRPSGGAAAAAARDYLVRELRALGLAPEIQTETVRTASVDLMGNVRVTLAEVRNVLVRLPGVVRRHHAADGSERPAAALALAHYDSGADTLGAADGAASAAAMLETLRVLKAAPPPDNDLLFVFTDADAGQALGTRGFVQAHPWLRRARVVLRFDHAGNRGPLELIDTDGADDDAIDAWTRAAPDARGSSFMAALYRSLPQRARGAPLLAAGVPLLHFATTGGDLGGGAWDIPERLAPASLQHEGDTMLALLRHFGARPPARSDGARGQVVFALPGIGNVHYGYGLALPLAVLSWVLTLACCHRALWRMGIAGEDVVHGVFGFLSMACLATFVAHLCWESQAALPGLWRLGVLVDDATVAWQTAAFMLLPAAVFVPLQRHLQRKHGMMTVALGVLCVGSAALTGAAFGAPGATEKLR